jgi:hypothetical protein
MNVPFSPNYSICGDSSGELTNAMQNVFGVTWRCRFINLACLPSVSRSAGEKSRSKVFRNRIYCLCFIRFAFKGDLFFCKIN